jgi:hypothetical protein
MWGFLLFFNPVLFIISIIQAIMKKSPGWIILSVITGFFILIPAFLFFTGVYKATSNRRANVSKMQKLPESKMIISKDGSCILTIPASWIHLEKLNKKASIRVGSQIHQQYLTVITGSKGDGTFEEYAATASDKLQSRLKGSKKGEAEELFIGDKRALRYQLTGTRQGVKMTYILTVIEGAKGYYQVLAWTTASSQGENLEVLKLTANTFREK